MDKIYDVCVIGAGVNGSAAAFSLIKQKKNVLLLEQFPVPHTRGSSHGQSRIIRCSYEDKIYSNMTHDAFPIWKELEEKVGEQLLIQNGVLVFFDNLSSDNLKNSISALNSVDATHEVLTGEEVNARFPLFNIPTNFSGLYEHGGGTLLASKCVTSLHKVFVQNGGTFNDSEPVSKITPGDVITVKTSKAVYKAKSIIITAGSYTSKLTKMLELSLPLRVERIHPLYWKLDDPLSGSTSNNFPSFRGLLGVYGLAAHEYPGHIKICQHSGPPVDMERVDDVDPDLSVVKGFISDYMKCIQHRSPSIIETCLYTVTPDHNFIIDVHPKYKNIVIGAGFSGTGFKMAPVTGNVLADLALGRVPSYDLSLFRMDRFKDVVQSNSKL